MGLFDNVEPFTFEEQAGAGLSVELSNTTMPFGQPRQVVAFETGGKTTIADDGIYNPNSDRVVLQIMDSTHQRPLVVKGHLRDSLLGGVGLAKGIRDAIEQIRLNANPVQITYDTDTFDGLLWETMFGLEGPGDITYTLTFFISTGPLGAGFVPSQSSIPGSSVDVTLQIIAQLAVIEAMAFAQDINLVASGQLALSWNNLGTAMSNLATSSTVFEAGTLGIAQQAINAAKNMDTAAAVAQTQVTALRALNGSMGFATALIAPDANSQNAFSSAQAQTDVALAAILDQLRTVRVQAKTRIKKTSTLYRVQPGDTLESIAQQQLGSRARASDLGLASSDLVAGNYVRIPEG